MIFEGTSIRSEVRQTPIHVGGPPNMLATKDKIEPLSSQKVGHQNKQPRVKRLVYFIMPYGMGKC
jgi:hypothetical protein